MSGPAGKEDARRREPLTLLLCGDVMLGRAVDQILPNPGDPRLHELYASSAAVYLDLAEQASGPIPRAVNFSYVWGDALDALSHPGADVRIINLETSITNSSQHVPKGINYRMSPDNAQCLSAARIDCCVLANNHVLDWSEAGLLETLATLDHIGIRHAGAGRDAVEAAAPAILDIAGRGRVLIFAFGDATSGILPGWAASAEKPGVNLLPSLSRNVARQIADHAKAIACEEDLLVASIHWGSNWGYDVPEEQRRFAHDLIDLAGFHVIHGHSSHHAKGIEIFNGRPILYGCGDFLNDYEGISGYEEKRGDLAVLYLARFATAPLELLDLEMLPLQIRKFRLNRASPEDRAWLQTTLDRESRKLGTRILMAADGRFSAEWSAASGTLPNGSAAPLI